MTVGAVTRLLAVMELLGLHRLVKRHSLHCLGRKRPRGLVPTHTLRTLSDFLHTRSFDVRVEMILVSL
jgi:hypothetical protein